jgi:hypothetical protein
MKDDQRTPTDRDATRQAAADIVKLNETLLLTTRKTLHFL